MDNKGINGMNAGLNGRFEAPNMAPMNSPDMMSAQMGQMNQMTPEQMQSMMRMMQEQLNQMRANGNAGAEMQDFAGPENINGVQSENEAANVEQSGVIAEQGNNKEAAPVPVPIASSDDEEKSQTIVALEQETANIPMKRDGDNIAFITKVMGKVNWKNPHDAVAVMDWSRWKYMEKTFLRKKGDGYGSGRVL